VLLQRPALGLVLGCFLGLPFGILRVEGGDHFGQICAERGDFVQGFLRFELEGFESGPVTVNVVPAGTGMPTARSVNVRKRRSFCAELFMGCYFP